MAGGREGGRKGRDRHAPSSFLPDHEVGSVVQQAQEEAAGRERTSTAEGEEGGREGGMDGGVVVVRCHTDPPSLPPSLGEKRRVCRECADSRAARKRGAIDARADREQGLTSWSTR